MTTRTRSVTVVMVAIALSSLLGCAPEPAPVPTPTPAFASEEEAFAAAEEVYRAYNDAENRSRAPGAGGGPAPEDYLVGTALEEYLDGRDLLRLKNLKLEGDIGIFAFHNWSTDLENPVTEVAATVCLDLTATRTVEVSSGADLSPPSPPAVMSQKVTLVHDGERLLISSESEGDESSCSQD